MKLNHPDPTSTPEAGYRRLALAILELDVASLSDELLAPPEASRSFSWPRSTSAAGARLKAVGVR